MTDEQLRRRRDASLAPSYQLFYDDPVELVRGDGVWVFDADDNRFLDCYNNVPSVGHAHPRVVAALADQSALINTHTRYLHRNVVELAERLGDMLPGDLGTCYFVCTGTEANDLAMQIARAVTGHDGAIVTEHSYHGNSDLVRLLSTDGYPDDERPDWLGVVEPPNTYRGPFGDEPDAGERYAALVGDAIDDLDADGHGVAAMLIDTSWDSNGVLVAPPGYVARSAEIVRGSGGLVIADEVQAGYCRLGHDFWGHTIHGLVPDIVTIGKPMGAGHPVAAVVTTPEIAAEFADPPQLLQHVRRQPGLGSGRTRRTRRDRRRVPARELAANRRSSRPRPDRDRTPTRDHRCGPGQRAVLGSGSRTGPDDPGTHRLRGRQTDRHRAAPARHPRRRHGPIRQRVKIRPPLVFREEHVDLLATELDQVLDDVVLRGGPDEKSNGAEW